MRIDSSSEQRILVGLAPRQIDTQFAAECTRPVLTRARVRAGLSARNPAPAHTLQTEIAE